MTSSTAIELSNPTRTHRSSLSGRISLGESISSETVESRPARLQGPGRRSISDASAGTSAISRQKAPVCCFCCARRPRNFLRNANQLTESSLSDFPYRQPIAALPRMQCLSATGRGNSHPYIWQSDAPATQQSNSGESNGFRSVCMARIVHRRMQYRIGIRYGYPCRWWPSTNLVGGIEFRWNADSRDGRTLSCEVSACCQRSIDNPPLRGAVLHRRLVRVRTNPNRR